ncbi:MULTISPECIES: NAD(P)-dependent alcohol dehydrogenase [Chryseobacterium]|uniref:Zinc-type alcohol dehydrogenase-like protein n=1 Tax=Chryseobacterium camelliae TaxID=1265445 RepID=A0ABU0TKS5_9FLAO|nr:MULTISPECIES: NAD(P)-dependent alcohol dehydrogenase [Chryseobacterium]MDT3408501.1 putative zinc-type alcohol dehydrogenase-like protein [Pseudacidovorax intermedius]MDQ1097644.1 putative zinc-type alcohol dehydrogenase-like protein [Chryseobacterium camelliae]MDQ1101573.1 putative zinc-type alcohol dehydrogenase-like protein [Chryseobacterium sp. SORGH_AS_1048]MDR6085016.1 putative zinc-type alcohol dehydrogenase-like protein [Chryseobacterium sp. SORGH_AS_0909]MDR6129371.1 putative zinc-
MNTFTVKAYGAESTTADLKEMNIDRRTVTAKDIEIEILYCGVCHSDLHTVRNDWGGSQYPVVPGHEIVGRITAVGSEVSKLKVGDLAAVGCMVDSCRTCDSCKQDLEQYCLNGFTGTYNGKDKHLGGHTFGGYSQKVVVDEHFVLKVPENLDLAAVAPLLCAGITTWSPLRHWKAGPDSKVAVVGLGGLGHMAIKLAKGLGAEVTLFSRTPGKTEDAKRLGADHIVISTDDEEMKSVAGKFDLIIDTVPYEHDVNPYMQTLTLNGTLVLVGFVGQFEEVKPSSVPMIFQRRSIAGSLIGGIAETQELLDFCGEHNIVSDIEVIKMQDINTAYERMLKSDVKYRFVIDMQSLQN